MKDNHKTCLDNIKKSIKRNMRLANFDNGTEEVEFLLELNGYLAELFRENMKVVER